MCACRDSAGEEALVRAALRWLPESRLFRRKLSKSGRYTGVKRAAQKRCGVKAERSGARGRSALACLPCSGSSSERMRACCAAQTARRHPPLARSCWAPGRGRA